MRLTRLTPLGHSSAGRWLVPEQGLLLLHRPEGWAVQPTEWISTRYAVPARSDGNALLGDRRQWLTRHGLGQARFASLRAGRQTLEYALQRSPLSRWQQVVGCD